MFPFKVQLFQGCKSETEPINTKSVTHHVIQYQVLLAAYYIADTKYCCCCAKGRQFPICLAFLMTINKSQGHRLLTKSAYTFRNLYSVTGNYMLLSQEFNHWAY
jgi:hypothetical protein